VTAGTDAPLAAQGEGRVARKRQRRIREIMQTAARVVAERGYHATSLEDIAEEMDVAKATLYHYFSSKEELFRACLENISAEVFARMEAVAAQPGTATERLHRLVTEQVLILTHDYSAFAPLFLHPIQWPDGLLTAVRRGREHNNELFVRVIKDGVAGGEFAVSDPMVARQLMHGALNHIPDWYRPRQRLQPQRLADFVADQVVLLFVGRPAADA
jgi:AcrR family transcriptional regulator